MLPPFRALTAFLILVFASIASAPAQVPDTQLLALAPSPLSPLTGPVYAVAVDGNLTVIGVPADNTGAQNSGVVRVYDSTTGSLLHTLSNPSPAASSNFGRSVAISGTRVVVGCPNDDFGIQDAGTAYVFDLSGGSPTVPIATLHNPTPMITDIFGTSVAIAGSRVLIGAPGDRTGGLQSGSAYLYDLLGATPTVPVATLDNPNPAPLASFGYAVALSGTTAVIGSQRANRAYVYDFAGTTPATPVVSLDYPTPQPIDAFGSSVAISGHHIVVGAPGKSAGTSEAGSAYYYDLSSGTPGQPAAIWSNPSPVTDGHFGRSVALDGVRAAIGTAPDNLTFQGQPVSSNLRGTVFLYSFTSNNPDLVLDNPQPAGAIEFGAAVALSNNRLVVAAQHADPVDGDAGTAFFFDLGAGVANQASYAGVIHSASPSLGAFGQSVALSGTRLVVGAPTDDTDGHDVGLAYLNISSLSVFEGGSPNIIFGPPRPIFHKPSPAPGDQFGAAVAISGTRVVISAPFDDTGALDAGSVYVFDLQQNLLATIHNPTPDVSEQFGSSVAIDGNLLIIGTPQEGTMGGNAGAAYVYDLSSATPTVPIATLFPSFQSAGYRFGCSVAISGLRVVVGASGRHADFNIGYAYVFDLTGGQPLGPVALFSNPTLAFGDEFGSAVAISGSRVVVGAHRDASSSPDTGRAFVYDVTGANPNVPVATLTCPNPVTGDEFGCAVAISGDHVLIGARGRERYAGPIILASDAGAVFCFDLAGNNPTIPQSTLTGPNLINKKDDFFGSAVALDGPLAIVGEPLSDSYGFDRGAAYVFGSSANTAPVVTLLGDNPLTIEASLAQYQDAGATAADAEDGPLSVVQFTPTFIQYSRPGNYTTQWLTSDSGGLRGSATRTIHVVDTTPPTLVLGTNLTLEATGPATQVNTYPQPQSIGDVTGFPTLTYAPPVGSSFALGTTVVTGKATDSSGNFTTATFTITIVDTTPPTISPLADVTVQATSPAGAVVTYPAATASDAVGIASITYSQDSGTTFPIGITTVTATAHDFTGHTASTFFTVAVTQDAPEKKAPVVVITAPSGRSVAGSFTISGTVKDDATLASFTVKLNGVLQPLGAPLVFAPDSNVPWTVTGATPENGVNRIEVEAVDLAGHHTKATKLVTFTNQRPALAGIYPVLLQPTGTPDNHTAGLLSVTVASTGAFSGSVTIAGKKQPFSGLLENDGTATFKPGFTSDLPLPAGGVAPASLGRLAFTITDPAGLQATLTKATAPGNVLASGQGKVANFGPKNLVPTALLNQPAAKPVKGAYNVSLPSKAQSPVLDSLLYPQGDGYLSLTLTNRGAITVLGKLADGSKFSAASNLRTDHSVPLFAALYKNTGFAGGELTFDNLADTDLSGTGWLWFRAPDDHAAQFTGGWTQVRFDPIGTFYTRPTSLDFGQGSADLVQGNASLKFATGPLTKTVSLSPETGVAKKVPAHDSSYTLKFAPATGLFTGTVRLPDGQPATYGGVLLNKGLHLGGFGYLISPPPAGTGATGRVTLDPAGP